MRAPISNNRSDTLRTKALKKYFPHASTKNIAEYLENLRWIEETLFHWASLVESTDDAIYSKDLDGIITSWNPAAEKIYGYKTGEIVGKSILTIFPDNKKNEFKSILRKIKRGEKIDHYETKRKCKNGQLIDVSVTISPVKDITGKITGASVIARDITQQKQWQEARYRLASIIDSADDAIISKDLNGIITSWNKGAERMYGYTAEEMVGKSISVLVPPGKADELPRIMRRLKRGEKIEHYETKRVAKDGRVVTVSLIISPIRDGDGKVIGASKIAHQVTQQLELERQKELNQQKNDFISMASHELKTPLTTLKAHIQLCLKENKKLGNALIERSLTKADGQISRLTNLVNELLTLSRMQGNRHTYQMDRFDLNELVRDVVEDCQGYSNAHRLILKGKAAQLVYGDKDKIGQVLINLLTNAVKYSVGADKVIISISNDSANAIVKVKDFGIGIDIEHHDKVFEQFYQVTSPEEKTYPGMGIGLYIAAEIIRAHNGRIWVESKKGQGSTFSFSLPFIH